MPWNFAVGDAFPLFPDSCADGISLYCFPMHPQISRAETMNADENAIAAVLATYQGALNQSSTDAVMRLYSPDGVFMPQHSPSNAGADAVR
jgi:hypothetical protein